MQHVRAILQLMRLPAVFTAMADIFMGFLLTHDWLSPSAEFAGLLCASSSLYLAGMVLNDTFDRQIDAEERPGRPIPSGRVSLSVAIGLGAALLVAGIAAAAGVGHASLQIAIGLAALILAYDGLLKNMPVVGPIAMGGCRALNVLLGASVAGTGWYRPPSWVALAMGIYVGGVTWFARQEAERSRRRSLIAAAGVIHVGIGALAAALFAWPVTGELRAAGELWIAVAGLVIVTAALDVSLVAAVRNPVPSCVQQGVKRLLLAIIVLDATLVYFRTGNTALTIATAALLIPAATLGRWIFIT